MGLRRLVFMEIGDEMSISVAIPVWEYYNRGVEMLDSLFLSIKKQNTNSIQVVVSDQSLNDDIENFCKNNIYDLEIKYVREPNRGNPAYNHNNAIDNCDRDIIKVMQQDDYFYDNYALEKIKYLFNQHNADWLVCGCIHTNDDGRSYYGPMIPRWDERMILTNGNNYIGGVSVLAIKNGVIERFDPVVRMLLDVDLYYNLKINHGHPIYCTDYLIANRSRNVDTLYAEISESEVNEEFNYVHRKYGIQL